MRHSFYGVFVFRKRNPSRVFLLICSMLFMVQAGLSGEALADPPPWAPAHGYYKNKDKGKQKYKHGDEGRGDEYYAAEPRYVSAGRCNREGIGSVIGGAVGGMAGSRIGEGNGKTAAIIAGTIVGAIIGRSVGRSMDQVDIACVGQALEYGDEGRVVSWRNPDTGADYHVTPLRTYQQNSGYCREFMRETILGGHREQVYGKACRQPDGSWKIVG